MLKTADELKAQAIKLQLKFYHVHDCSMCGYRCGYIIALDKVAYDSGCYCVGYTDIQPRSWEDLAETYNMNQPENNPEISQEFLDEENKTWQFIDSLEVKDDDV